MCVVVGSFVPSELLRYMVCKELMVVVFLGENE